ncbi:MAG: type I-B CRISPR-associated protein Cas7/Cst2/DevR [Candidatus Thorarchaeota archaeon]
MTCVIHGIVFIDAWAAALNNAGAQPSERTDNIVRTKVFWREGQAYPYVSGQAWRYWWRMTLVDKLGWTPSPVTRERKIAYTQADPLRYPDDDIFGYMRAPKVRRDSSGKKLSAQTVTRVSVLKNSPLVSVGPHRPVEDFGVFSRFEGDPVPFEHEFYSTIMKGLFSIDVETAGVFKQMPIAGSQNLPDDFVIPSDFEDKCTETDGMIVLNKEIRVKRVTDVLKAIPHLNGGAMSTRHLTRVAPSLIVLGAFRTGSHVFSHLATQLSDGRAGLHVTALRQVLDDYGDELVTRVYVGREEGFLDYQREDIEAIARDYDRVVVTSVKRAVEGFCEEVPSIVE